MKELQFTSEEILKKKYIIDLPDYPEDFIADRMYHVKGDLYRIDAHSESGKKAEFYIYVEKDAEIETAGDVLSCGWDTYDIYFEE